MKNILVASNAATKKEENVKHLKVLKIKKVGTAKVESLARRYVVGGQGQGQEEQGRSMRHEEEVVRVLRDWLRQEEKKLKMLWMVTKRKMKDLEDAFQELECNEEVDIEEIKKKVEDELVQEKQRYQQTFEEFYSKKVSWLIHKFKKPVKKTIDPRWKGVKVTNQQVKEEKEARSWKKENNFIVLDDIKLDEDEKEYVNLPHKFREYDKVETLDIELSADVFAATQRWEMMKREEVVEEDDVPRAEVEKRKEEKKKEMAENERKYQEASRTVDRDRKRIDMSRLRVTNLKNNPRLIEPRPAMNTEEIKIQAQKQEVVDEAKKVVKQKEESKDGSNLNAKAERGKKKLRKRIKDGSIVVGLSDKSDKLVISKPETYKEAAKEHVEKDEKVPWETLVETERLINRHSAALRKALKVGEAHPGQAQRVKSAMKSVDSAAPPLYLMWKDHKDYEQVPPTRPVCGAKKGPLVRNAEIVSDILEVLLDDAENDVECASSEEMQRAMEDANEEIERLEIEDAVIFSTDVKALYPSLDLDDVLEAVEKVVIESKYELENVDVKELAKYLKIVVTKEELERRRLTAHLPRRAVEVEGRARGAVTIAYLDSDTYTRSEKGKKTIEEKWLWNDWSQPGAEERKVMVALMLREQVKVMMKNHLYSFDGHLYRQVTGGSIGLLLTSTTARAVLGMFDREFKRLLSELNLGLLLQKRYVDDLNMATRAVPLNVDVVEREGRLELVEVEGREGVEADAHTAMVIRKVADSVRPRSIRMTEDYPSNHPDRRMPILDMKVNIYQGFIEHRHYSKPMASKSVIMASSAFTASEKLNILVNEGNRRLKNHSPQMSWLEKKKNLDTLMIQMEECGHSEDFRGLVAVRTVSRYSKSLKNHLEGRRRMYRSRQEQQEQVRAAGGKASKSNWFKKSGATNVLRVPATKDSYLAKAVETALERTASPTGLVTKVVEEPGPSVRSSLVRSNPFPRSSCGRELCPWLARGEECAERCYQEGVTYLSRCKRCREEQLVEGVREEEVVDQVYIGESHRSVVTRCRSHLDLYKPGRGRGGREVEGGGEGEDEEVRKAGSWMREHTLLCHGGVFSEDKLEDYEFFILRVHSKVLRRQLEEAILLDWAETRGIIKIGRRIFRVNKKVLNSKFEHWRPRPVFIVGR